MMQFTDTAEHRAIYKHDMAAAVLRAMNTVPAGARNEHGEMRARTAFPVTASYPPAHRDLLPSPLVNEH
jgi:hypothetical protein